MIVGMEEQWNRGIDECKKGKMGGTKTFYQSGNFSTQKVRESVCRKRLSQHFYCFCLIAHSFFPSALAVG